MQEHLESFDLGDTLKKFWGINWIVGRPEPTRFRRVAQPFPLFGVSQVRMVITSGG